MEIDKFTIILRDFNILSQKLAGVKGEKDIDLNDTVN